MENFLQNLLLTDNSSNFDDERSLDPDFLAIIGYAHYIYLFLSVFGLILNCYVLVRLIAQVSLLKNFKAKNAIRRSIFVNVNCAAVTYYRNYFEQSNMSLYFSIP